MINALGVDIIEIERIERAIQRWGRPFVEHLFTQDEIQHVAQYKFPAQHYAVRFAAKEAIYKAFGGTLALSWQDVAILNDARGKPYCVFKDKSLNDRVLISLSHSKHYAIANALVTS